LSKALAYAATSKTSPMTPITISRRELRSNDVNIEILYCGVCHTDVHTAHDEWDGLIYPNGTIYPRVPGHEIVGRVTLTGPDVKRFTVGEFVAVGTMVDSCLECDNCKAGLEPYCQKYATWTYNAPDRISGDNTQRGYSDSIVVREEFVLKLNFPAQSLCRRGTSALCRDHDVVAFAALEQEIEMAFVRMVKNDVKYRFVVDMKSLKANG
jgi:uncharacterized zinc-type alcohol dehydrogenase-like protein